LGASYGAMASLGYAIKYPDHLTKLILLAGAPSYKFIETAKKNLEKKGTVEQKAIAQKLWNGAFRDAKEFTDYYKIMMPLYSVNSTVEPPATSEGIPYNIEVTNLGFSQFLRTFNFENDMEKISCQTLIICGADDWVNDPSHAKFMAEKIPKSTLHIFDRCGHFAEDDQPELFFNALDDFLEKHLV
jgi:proline iminopeptidase